MMEQLVIKYDGKLDGNIGGKGGGCNYGGYVGNTAKIFYFVCTYTYFIFTSFQNQTLPNMLKLFSITLETTTVPVEFKPFGNLTPSRMNMH